MTSARITDDDIKVVFDLFDTDGSGAIDCEELLCALKALGWNRATRADALKVITSIDKDETGTVDLFEFTEIVRDKSKSVGSADEIQAAFRLFDIEGKGRLTADNLRTVGERVTGEPVSDSYMRDLMTIVDTNEDGVIDFEEFKAAVTPMQVKVRCLPSRPKKAEEEPRATTTTTLPTKDDDEPVQDADEVVDEEQPEAEAQEEDAVDEEQEAVEEAQEAELAEEEPEENVDDEEQADADEEVAEENADAAPQDDESYEPTTEVIAGVNVVFDKGPQRASKQSVRTAFVELGYGEDMLSEDDFTAMFDSYDKDNDGIVTKHEVCQLFVGMGEMVDGY